MSNNIKTAKLPEKLVSNPFTPAQWSTLLAIADAIVAPADSTIQTTSSDDLSSLNLHKNVYTSVKQQLQCYADETVVDSYLKEHASGVPGFEDVLLRFLAVHTLPDSRKSLGTILTLLDTRPGSLVLTGSTTSFSLQPIHVREAVIQSWCTARLPLFRLLHRQLTTIIKQTWARTSPTLGPMLGYPRMPTNHKQGKGYAFDFLQFPPAIESEVLDVDVVIVGSGCGAGVCAKKMAEAGLRTVVVERSYYWPPEYLPMTDLEGPEQLFMNGGVVVSDDTSIAVFAGQTWGGGGTINWSASLQTPGYVRQEWASHGLPHFTSPEYQDCLDTICNRMGVSTEHIRHNKANATLLEGARRLGWNARAVPQNTGGKEHYCGYCTYGCGACEKQGPAVSFLPDAARSGATFVEGFEVQRVLFEKTKNGRGRKAVGVQGVWTSKDAHGGVADESSRITRNVTIRSRAVIVSAGTLQSPLLLLRSGIRNRNVGRNLHLHPVSLLAATYDEETRPWEGGIITSLVTEFENLDGHGYGAKLEPCVMLPGSWLAVLPWGVPLGIKTLDKASSAIAADQSSIENVDQAGHPPSPSCSTAYKLAAVRMRNTVSYISLTRDRDSGRVYPERSTDGKYNSRPRIKYNPTVYDRKHMLEGIIALAKIQYAAGAREIFMAVPGAPEPFVRKGKCPASTSQFTSPSSTSNPSSTSTDTVAAHSSPSTPSPSITTNIPTSSSAANTTLEANDTANDDARFKSFLSAIRAYGLPSPATSFLSAHQMSSCRMSSSAADGVVDARGKVWGVDEGLYVADASVLPSASGVNPMVSTMATAEGIARGVVRDLRGVDENASRARL